MLLIGVTIVCAAIASLVALFALLRNPSSSIHRWLFLLILGACLWVISVNLHSVVAWDLGVWLLRFAFVAATVLGFAMLQFSTALCNVQRKLLAKLSAWLLLVVGAALSLSPWVIEGFKGYTPGGAIEPDRGAIYPIVLAIIMYFIVHAIVLLAIRHRKVKGLRRVQTLIVEMSLLIGTIVGVFTNIVLPNITQTTDPSRFAFLAIIILTVGLLYAVVQHRFLDIRLAAARTVTYALSFGVVALVYTLTVFAVSGVFFEFVKRNEAIDQAINISVAVLLAVSFHSMKTFFDRITNKLFFRDAYDTKEILDEVSDILVKEVTATALVQKAGKVINRAIKSTYLEVALVSRSDNKVDRRITVGRHDVPTDALISSLQRSSAQSVTADDLLSHGGVQQALIDANIGIAVRLQTSKEQVGYMLFGYRANGAAYTQQDIDLARIAADELAVAIQNTLRFEEILHFNETLSEEVKEATAQLRDSNKKLRKLDEAKDEFISMASHQLRTPLTSVKGYISMALEGDGGKLNESQSKLLEEAFASAQRMVYLIGDFLNVSRLQTGKFVIEPKPVDLSQIIRQELDQLKPTAARRNITLEYAPPVNFPVLYIDEDKIRQVIMNFTDNAIFYSKPGGKVQINLIATAEEVRLTVRDNGIGVPEAERHKLFAKFYRAENARKVRPDGTGIGLFMAKKVITAQGGSIIFESREGVGSTFGFSLPLNLKEAPKTNQPQEQPAIAN